MKNKSKAKKIIALLATTSALSLAIMPSVPAGNFGVNNSVLAAVNTQTFADVPSSHWAYDYINEMYTRGVVNGFPDGKFYPSSTVTRAEFAKMMTTAANINVANASKAVTFTDVDASHWALQYINAAKPYLSSYQTPSGAAAFHPSEAAVREDIAVAMVLLKGINVQNADESILKTMFSDYSSISSNARKYIAVALENGIVSGYDDGTFRAQSSITRAEAVAMMWRAFQQGSDSKQWDNVTLNQQVPPTFANSDDKKDDSDDDIFNQPSVPTSAGATVRPTIKPTQTPEPVKEDEDSETQIPVETPDSNEDAKTDGYFVDTIDASYSASNGTENIDYITFDENSDTVYWYNKSENVIKSMNGDSRKVKDYLDLNDLRITKDGYVVISNSELDEPYYDDICATEIFYDVYEDNMIIKFGANKFVDPNLLESQSVNAGFLFTYNGDYFDAIDNEDVTNELFEDHIHYSNNKGYIVGLPGIRFVDMNTGKYVTYGFNNVNIFKAYIYNGDIYVISNSSKYGDTSNLYKISVSSGSKEWETIQNIGMVSGVGINSEKCYIFDLNREAIISCSSTGKLNVEIDLSNLKVLDMLPVRFGSDHANEAGEIVVTNNMNVVYYDAYGKALRIIYKD